MTELMPHLPFNDNKTPGWRNCIRMAGSTHFSPRSGSPWAILRSAYDQLLWLFVESGSGSRTGSAQHRDPYRCADADLP